MLWLGSLALLRHRRFIYVWGFVGHGKGQVLRHGMASRVRLVWHMDATGSKVEVTASVVMLDPEKAAAL
jgi:Uri superfamily endonuclease